MGKSSSNDELTIRNQFDRICKLALKGEAADYYRHIAYRQKHEVLFSELSLSAFPAMLLYLYCCHSIIIQHIFSKTSSLEVY